MCKRFIAMGLLLCLLLPAASLAQAAREPLLLLGLEEEPRSRVPSFWKAHPEISKRDCDYHAFDDWTTLILEKRPDVFRIESGDCDFAALKQTGVLADLSGSEIIRDAVDRLRPDIKALVTDEAGRILAVPTYAYAWPFMWNQDAWDAAGYTEADVPQTYAELLDFLDAWVRRIAEEPMKNVCASQIERWDTGTAKYNDMYWLMYLLLSAWETQHFYAGQLVRFHTPEFIALAERAREVGLALYKAEPRNRKRQKMMPLFTPNGGEGFGTAAGLDYSFSHAIPLRLAPDQPALTRASARLLAVRADSEWQAEALAFIEHTLAYEVEPDWEAGCELFTGFEPGTYTNTGGRTHTYTEGWVRDLDTFAGHFAFTPTRLWMYEGTLLKFLKGDLSAEQLALALDTPKHNPND